LIGHDEEEDDEYDLSPDEDELDLDMLVDGEESDDLDDLDDPRITEVDSDDDAVPKLVSAKGKNKRAAEDLAEGVGLDDMIAKDTKSKAAVNGDATLSKKQQKKLKKNNGEAAAVELKKASKESPASSKTDKKVQFAKNLEQGPTPSTQDKKTSDTTTGILGSKEVQGVKSDDKKLGKGPAAKSGTSVSMRYIGKLENGKVFDGKCDSYMMHFD
jgi:FK506-binding nuclear protein